MEESRPSPDRLSASCLGKLLVMQAVVGSLPDEKSIFSFVCRGLADIPGVVEARHSSTPGEIKDKEHHRFPLHIGNAEYGELLLRVTDTSSFMPYEPYLNNFSLMLAVILRERELRRINESHTEQLEKHVQERTAELRRQIAERESIEESLRESEARFRATFEQAAMGIALVATDGRWLRVNDKLCDIVGYPREELLTKTFQDITHPDDLETDLVQMRQVLAEEIKTYSMEKRYFRKDGSIVWINLTVALVRDDSGQPQYFISVVEDITWRKWAEDARRESEERYQELFDNANDIVYTHDIAGNFTSINKAAEGITGYTRDEALKINIGSIVAPEYFDVARLMLSRKVSEGGQTRYELEIVCKDGRRVPLEVSTRIIYKGDEAVGVQGIARDISERKRVEQEKGKLQEQLQQAMKMEAVGRLAGGVAHDFNNLLTAIIGNVSLALMRISPADPVGGLLVEANKAAERAAALTQQLLAFSRKQIIAPKVLDLNELIADLHTMLVRLIGENIDMKTVPCEGLGKVKVDAGQVEQILLNLAVNARDAMPDGGELIIETANVDLDERYCAMHSHTCPGRYVMLAVSDTGHGMSEEVKKQIFEPFFTTKPKGTGTGLGLATIYGVVKQSDGSIEVYSEVGKGTTFKIYFPRVEGEVAKPEESDPPMELLEGSETVLLVEDEEIVRNLCVHILERLGYRVMPAGNGEEAIALANEHKQRIDLLMTDVVMPGMHGRELANRLTRIHPETRVLFTSGYTDNAIVHHGVLDEGVSFIGKPYSPWALAKTVRDVLDKA